MGLNLTRYQGLAEIGGAAPRDYFVRFQSVPAVCLSGQLFSVEMFTLLLYGREKSLWNVCSAGAGRGATRPIRLRRRYGFRRDYARPHHKRQSRQPEDQFETRRRTFFGIQ